ncbi:MAG TPA: alkaline phosphatase D family protein [Acidimicrobiales bacterium]|jgi:alkaline phosphatase D|nr:alkaline phosphatase D family protein [Acidimicrobiales bacterium]
MRGVHRGHTVAVGSVFRHAAASFEPTSTSVILWTRLTGASSTRWTAARDAALTDVVASGEAATDDNCDGTVRVDVDGLDPATTYWYRFTSGDESSPLGRTRTMPADDSPVRLGLVCCGRYSYAPLTVYRALAEIDVDLVVHLGDYIYEDDGAQGPRDHRPPHTAVTLDDYRHRIAQVREDADAQSLHLRHPMVTVWDDHDLADNAWRDGAKAHDPEEHGSWRERVAAAAQARSEWLPGRFDDPLVTWRTVPIGRAGELVLLDTRVAGRDQHAGDDGTTDLHDPARSMLGAAQRSWLDERLGDVERPWSVVVSSVVVNPIVLRMPAIDRVNSALPNGYAALDGVVMHDDQWDGYPAERDHLVERVRERAAAGGRTLLLSGDVHASWAFEGPIDETGGKPVAVEATCPSTSSAPFARSRWPFARRAIHRAVQQLDHVRWCDLTERGFVVVEIAPGAVTAEWWFADADDDAESPDARRAATFRADREAWPPRWEEREPMDLARTPPSDDPVLPSRPDDIRGIRRTRQLLSVGAAAAGAAVVAAAATVASLWSRSGGRGAGSRLRLMARS